MEMIENMDFKLPRIGQRIVRSVTAVILCFGVYFLRGEKGIPFYSALAVLQCMQPYQDSTIKMAKNRLTGTFIGAFWGLVVLLVKVYGFSGGFRGNFWEYLLISLFVGVVLYSTVVLDVKNASYFSCVVFLSITVNHIMDENPFLFMFNRVLDTLIGVGLALIVNSVHLPRKKNKDTLFVSGIDDTILTSKNELSPYSKVELNRLIDSGANFTVSTIRTPASVRESLGGVKWKIPVIAMDGAVLYDMNENAYLKKCQMSGVQTKRITDFLDQEGFGYFSNTVVDDLLVIYYQSFHNEAEKAIFESKRKSPFRNYVKAGEPILENVVYLMLIDRKDKVEELYRKMQDMSWFEEYRIVKTDSEDYPGYTYIKIYHKDATREHMLYSLQQMLHMEKAVTFGSIEGKYDVFVKDCDRDTMVKQLKKLYEPVAIAMPHHKQKK